MIEKINLGDEEVHINNMPIKKYIEENYVSKKRIIKYMQTLEEKLDELKVNVGGNVFLCMSYLTKSEQELVKTAQIQLATMKEILEEE